VGVSTEEEAAATRAGPAGREGVRTGYGGSRRDRRAAPMLATGARAAMAARVCHPGASPDRPVQVHGTNSAATTPIPPSRARPAPIIRRVARTGPPRSISYEEDSRPR